MLSSITHRLVRKIMSGVSTDEPLEETMKKEKDWDQFIDGIVDKVMGAAATRINFLVV